MLKTNWKLISKQHNIGKLKLSIMNVSFRLKVLPTKLLNTEPEIKMQR